MGREQGMFAAWSSRIRGQRAGRELARESGLYLGTTGAQGRVINRAEVSS